MNVVDNLMSNAFDIRLYTVFDWFIGIVATQGATPQPRIIVIRVAACIQMC